MAQPNRIPNDPKYFITKDGRVWSSISNIWLKPVLKSNGYLVVTLSNRKIRGIHCLVLETYIGPCPDGMEACHNNGIKPDNRLENLRWDTKRANQLDRQQHGTWNFVCGEDSKKAKLTEKDVRMIIYMWRTREFKQYEIAKIYGIGADEVSRIVNKKRWKHLWEN